MSIEEKYKAVIVNSNYIIYGVEGFFMDEETLAEDYLTIQPYENEIRKDYEAIRETIEAVVSNRHFSHEDLNDSYWFIAGAYNLCEHFRNIRRKKQLEAKIMNSSAVAELNPLVDKADEWLIYQFRTKERLSFFLDRCEHKRNAKIARELKAAVKARFLRITDKDDNNLKEAMRKSLSGLLNGIATQQAWHSVMIGTAAKDEVARLAKDYEDFMKSEAV